MENKNQINSKYALQFQQGKEEGFGHFFKELYPALIVYANHYVKNKETAEEIASDAFINTWKNREKLDCYNAIKAYLYKTVYHAAIYTQQKSKRKNVIEKAAASADENNDTPFEHTVRTETYRLIHSAIEGLAPGNQKVIKMYYLEGKTSGQIAKELKLSVSTVKTQKKLGMAALRKRLLQFLLFAFVS